MNIDAPAMLKDQREKQNFFVEVGNAEKQLWALIHSKGLLHTDVQDLYRKARAGYENIILNDHEVVDLQDVEFFLWKLHYKHIDEYRKRIRQTSVNAESTKLVDVANVQNSIDCHMEGFKSFLSEATEFYNDLIKKTRRCGILEEPLLYKKDGGSVLVEQKNLRKCQFACHRFLVCLGDLARYRELCKQPDIQIRKWSVAATYYLEAAMIWPDSGNPQNQLALLATYVGDDFLALYHCVRSLAVKEPFPDARDNLMLLFEKNKSSHWHSLSSEAPFDFLNPSERSCSRTKSHANSGSSNNIKLDATEYVSSEKTDIWLLFVRMISFFFLKSSSDDFPCTFASTMRELEAFLALDDTKLKASLESYEHMDSARRGPYRALQVVSILIFVIHSLVESPVLKDLNERDDIQKASLTQLAWISTFICMGRLLDRCLTGNHPNCCPLLAAVLVFVEWFVGMLDKVETYGADEKFTSAISYFFISFGELLNRLDIKEGEFKSPDHTALWEDYELRGFEPLADAQESLDFSTSWDYVVNYDGSNVSHAHRILHAAMKIVDRSRDSGKRIVYDKLRRKFYSAELIKFSDQREIQVAEPSSDLEVKNQVHPSLKGESVAMEEEEVILFKPITRYNSAPLHNYLTTNDQMSMEGTSDQTAPPDECLRRATSLFVAQNPGQNDPSNFHSNATNFRSNKPVKPQEPLLKDSATYPAGPPSLSAWVLHREAANVEREKGTRDFCNQELSTIEELASASLTGLSIGGNKDYLIGSGQFSATTHNSSPPYVAPVPSAPLLPDNAVWFTGNSFSKCESAMGIKEEDGILGASPISGYSNWSATNGPFDYSPIPGFIGMSSSEWLYQYTNNNNLDRANNHIWPVPLNAPQNLGNFSDRDGSRFDLSDRWGNPLVSNHAVYVESPQFHPGSSVVYSVDEQRREKLLLGYQRPSPYGCGAGTDTRAEQPPLLQYLKEREWQVQRESQLRGPTYMGN